MVNESSDRDCIRDELLKHCGEGSVDIISRDCEPWSTVFGQKELFLLSRE